MAREKTWSCVQNIALSGTDDGELAQYWMYNLFSFLSGGAGNATAAWEILSASNASSVGGPGTITGSGDMTWNNSGAHTWWVCRKNILPVTASTTRYIYLTVDLEDSDDSKVYFSFDYNAPNFSGQSTSARPAETANNYEKDGFIYRQEYDAGNQAYFHGTIDTTGSFHVIGAQNKGAGNGAPYNFALSCARLETPTPPEIDPFPVLLRCNYSVGGTAINTTTHGCWSIGNTYQYYTGNNNNLNAGLTYSKWGASNSTYGYGGFAVWTPAGVANNTTGDNTGMMLGNFAWFVANAATGDSNGNYPLLPSFIYRYDGSPTSTPRSNIIRGRLPDVFVAQGSARMDGDAGEGYGLGGLSIPASGTIEYSVVGDVFLPFSASILPGA